MSTLFTRIINGEIPCEKIYEDDRFFSFMDINPIHPGHTLVVPKREVDKFFDMNEDELAAILVFAQPIARALESVVDCKRVGLLVAGLEIPHAHLHLVPLSAEGQLSFAYAKPADMDDLAALGGKIRAALQA